ncbi:hypothetical protein [Bacillus cereus]|uniref:hypothetical protein n=1 Tax=Bacillus cereus TaxID=1396 RepID=UPI001E2BEA21|nr:hypothetical protein [Bacillus cereus]
MKIEAISIEEAVQHLEEYQKGVQSLQHYKDQYKTLLTIKKENPELTSAFGIDLIKRLKNEGVISFKKEKRMFLYSLYTLAKYQLAFQLLNKHFYKIAEAIAELCYNDNKSPIPLETFEKRFCDFHNSGHIKVVLLNHKIHYNRVFIPKQEVTRFKKEYMSVTSAAKEQSTSLKAFRQHWLNQYPIDVVKLYQNDCNYMYLNKKDWQSILKEREQKKIQYTAKESLAITLAITPISVEKVAKEYNLITIKNENSPITYFKTEDVAMLIDKQNDLWQQIRNEYLTLEEATKILNIAHSTMSQKFIKNNVHSIYVPPLICTIRDGINFRSSPNLIYSKKDVLSINEKRKKEQNIENIIYQSESDPYEVLQTALREADITFSNTGSETAKYWFTFLKMKFSKSKATRKTIQSLTRTLFNTTILLTKITHLKEIFAYTDTELNLAIFNSNINTTVQIELYKFLKELSETRETSNLPINYKFSRLKNIYKKTPLIQREKTIYPIDEYIALIDYAKNIPEHKKQAIVDIRSQINSEKHLHRDSSWLYVLLHLNNAWRHYDVTSFPRLDLQQTQIGSMEALDALTWIERNNLSEQDIITVVNQVKAMTFTHSKTKKKRHFFCSQELLAAFAHSAVLCELRCQICQPLSEVLIDFNNRQRSFKEGQREAFFKKHNGHFIFKSTKMNRTLISYVYSVIQKTTNRNPLEITKFIRSHSDKETTNIYIDIPQEQMDFITKQLFDLGHFGYAYDALSELILQEPINNKEEKNQTSLTLKEVFGDVYHIEQMARYLNRLNNEQNIVYKVIKGLSLEERKDIYDSIKLGQQPSKKEYFQCLYQTCKFPNRDCEKCQFAIPNFYALSQLEEELQLTVNDFKEQFNTTTKKGEKIRLSNLLYNYLYLIEAAVKKFGKDEVSSFFKNGLEGFKNDLSSIPNIKEYVTIQR